MKRRTNQDDGHVKRIITTVVVVCVALLLGAGSVYGFRGSTADDGLRATLSYAEKFSLLKDEDRSLTDWEIEAQIALMDEVKPTETYGVKGNYKANLSLKERILLVLEENSELGSNDIPEIIASITRDVESVPTVGLGYHKPYISGSVMQNLDRAEKIRTLMEEDRALPRWEAEAMVDDMGPVQ